MFIEFLFHSQSAMIDGCETAKERSFHPLDRLIFQAGKMLFSSNLQRNRSQTRGQCCF